MWHIFCCAENCGEEQAKKTCWLACCKTRPVVVRHPVFCIQLWLQNWSQNPKPVGGIRRNHYFRYNSDTTVLQKRRQSLHNNKQPLYNDNIAVQHGYNISQDCLCLPNDHVMLVDHTPQRSVYNGKPIPDDDTGSAFQAVEAQVKQTGRHITHTHTLVILFLKNRFTMRK